MGEHYFSADPSVAFTRTPVHATVWGRELTLTSGSGVFAQGRLDKGTAVLLRETEPPTARRYLDLGCGYGVIGLALATAVGGSVVRAVDVNERAVLRMLTPGAPRCTVFRPKFEKDARSSR